MQARRRLRRRELLSALRMLYPVCGQRFRELLVKAPASAGSGVRLSTNEGFFAVDLAHRSALLRIDSTRAAS